MPSERNSNPKVKKVNENITSIETDSMARINENFVRLNSIINQSNVTIDRNTISYEYGNNILKINISDKSIIHNGNTDWIESTLDSLIKCLESNEIPKSGEGCDQCKYFESRMKLFQSPSSL